MAGIQFEERDLQEIISKVKQDKLNFLRQGDEVHRIEWNTNLCCWNMVHPELNENPIWLQLTRYSAQEVIYINNYLRRYEAFFDKCLEFKIVISV